MERSELDSGIEAVLFALGEPVPTEKLAAVLEAEQEAVNAACRRLSDQYRYARAGVRLLRLEDSWQMASAPEWGETIRRAAANKKADKLSQAALEVLGLVAYHQPVTRVYIDQVRGVDSAHSLALLLDREMIEPCGTLDVPGRPALYRTGVNFLRSFGLSSLEDLPELPVAPPGEDRPAALAMKGGAEG